MVAGFVDDDMMLNRLATARPEAEGREMRGIGPREFYAVLRRRFVLIALIVAAATGLSLVASYEIPKVFTARSMILLERDDPNLLEEMPDQDGSQLNRAQLDTQTDLMMSRVFAGRVVDALGLVDDPNFNPYLEQTAKPVGGIRGIVSGLAASAMRLVSTPDDDKGELPPVGVQRDRAMSTLLSRVTITRNGESLAMTVSVSDAKPKMAAKLANAVTDLFVEWSRDRRRENTKAGVEFLRQQATGLASRIAETERRIAEYGSRNGVSTDPRDDLLRAAMQQANEQLSAARADLTQAQARVEQVKQAAAKGTSATDPLLSSDFLTSLRNDEAAALRDKAQIARNYGANHPLVQEADARIESVRQLIAQEMQGIVANLENEVRVAAGRVGQFERDLAESNTKLNERSLAEIKLRELNRDLTAEQNLYDLVTARLAKLDPYAGVAKPSARVISVAEVPVEPSFPKRRVLVAGGLIAGLLVAFASAVALETLDTRVRDPKRVSQMLGAPVLASIPRLPRRYRKAATGLVDHIVAHPSSPFSNSFRILYNACRRGSARGRKQTVLVSSARPRENKTEVALGLAVTAATDGARTVLLDLDRHGGDIHDRLGLGFHVNPLDDFLAGRSDLHSVLQVAPGLPNLQVLAPAADDPAPTGILTSAELEMLLNALRDAFDIVIIDASPVLVVEDATEIAAQADTVLLVAVWDRTIEEAVVQAGERLRAGGAVPGGMVLTAVDPAALANGVLGRSRADRRDLKRYFAA